MPEKRWFDRMVLSAPMIDLPGRRTSFAARALLRVMRTGRPGRPLHSRWQRCANRLGNPSSTILHQRSRPLRPNAAILEEDPPRHRIADSGLGRYRLQGDAYFSRVELSVGNPPADPDAGGQQRHVVSTAAIEEFAYHLRAGSHLRDSRAPGTRFCRSRTATCAQSGAFDASCRGTPLFFV